MKRKNIKNLKRPYTVRCHYCLEELVDEKRFYTRGRKRYFIHRQKVRRLDIGDGLSDDCPMNHWMSLHVRDLYPRGPRRYTKRIEQVHSKLSGKSRKMILGYIHDAAFAYYK